MESKNKKNYVVPATLVVELETEGIVCASEPAGDRKSYGDAYELD